MERASWNRFDLIDKEDANYVSELSTVLVATIQETKDRISLIEDIFCSKLFPNIQSKRKSIQKVFSEAQKAAEDSWKKRETGLLVQLEEVKIENQKLIKENKELKQVETEKIQYRCMVQLLDCEQSLQRKINELEWKMQEKFIKLRDAEKLLNRLFKLVRQDGKHLVEYENRLNEQKRNTTELVEDLGNSKKENHKLQEDLRKKSGDINEAKKLREDTLKIKNYEDILRSNESEMKLQSINVKQLKESVHELQEALDIKIKEVDNGKKMQQQQFEQQIKQKNSELLIAEQHLKDHHCQNGMLSLKVKELEERVGQHQAVLQEKLIDQERKEESIKQLSYEIELNNLALESERNKTRDALVKYKKVTSQYLFLLKKFGLTPDSESAEEKKEAEVNSVFDAHNPAPSTDLKRRDPTVECNQGHAIKPKDVSGRNKQQNEEELA